MKRTTLVVALASAALSASAYANQGSRSSSQDERQQQSTSSSQDQAQQSPELVKKAQEKLSSEGKDVGAPDGKMGPKTQAALKEFQQEKGLEQTGELDNETIAALDIDQDSSSTGSSTGSSSTK